MSRAAISARGKGISVELKVYQEIISAYCVRIFSLEDKDKTIFYFFALPFTFSLRIDFDVWAAINFTVLGS